MAMDEVGLADEVATAMGYPFTSPQLIGWAKGVVEEVRNGVATFGDIPTPHTISAISGPAMADLIATYAGYGFTTPELINFCTAIATNIMADGIVTYASPPPAPPGLLPPDAWFLDGTISGLDGSAMAALVASMVGYPNVSTKLLAECTAIVSHIMGNAEVVSGVID